MYFIFTVNFLYPPWHNPFLDKKELLVKNNRLTFKSTHKKKRTRQSQWSRVGPNGSERKWFRLIKFADPSKA